MATVNIQYRQSSASVRLGISCVQFLRLIMTIQCCYCGKIARAAEGTTLHKLPIKQPPLLELWLKNMQLGSDFKPTNNMRLCSDHFSRDCLIKPGTNVQLREGSIPTIFGAYKSACVCCSAVRTHGTQRSFHKFPTKNRKLLEKWLVAIGKENYSPSETSLLCSDHFEDTCYRSDKSGSRRWLRDTAVPSIYEAVNPGVVEPNSVRRKRMGEALQEVPAKQQRRDDRCESAVQPTNNDSGCENTPIAVKSSTPETSCATEINNNCKSGKLFGAINKLCTVQSLYLM